MGWIALGAILLGGVLTAVLAPILEAWRKDAVPLESYPADSEG